MDPATKKSNAPWVEQGGLTIIDANAGSGQIATTGPHGQALIAALHPETAAALAGRRKRRCLLLALRSITSVLPIGLGTRL
jgi:hypothetical protein